MTGSGNTTLSLRGQAPAWSPRALRARLTVSAGQAAGAQHRLRYRLPRVPHFPGSPISRGTLYPRLAGGQAWAALGLALGRMQMALTGAPQPRLEVDPRVLGQARDGDPQAFKEIIDFYDSQLRALAFRLLGERQRMDDVLQNAYLQAYRGLPRFRGESSLGTWLYRITYRACIDELRRSKRQAATEALPGPDGAPERDQWAAPGPGPDEVAMQRVDLARALAGLPPEQRAAVLLVDAEGLDYTDAAAILGVRVGTLGSRLSRAHKTLRATLGEATR